MKLLVVLGLLAVFFQTDGTSLLVKGGSFPGSITRRGRGGGGDSISNNNNNNKCQCGSTEQNGLVNVGGILTNSQVVNCNQDFLAIDNIDVISVLNNLIELCAKGGEECSTNGCILSNLDLGVDALATETATDKAKVECCKEANCLDQTCSAQTPNTTDSGSYSDCCIACSNEDACYSDVSIPVIPFKRQ